MSSFCIIVYLHVAVETTEQLIAAMEAKKWFPFALLSSTKLFRTAVDSVFKVFKSSCKVTDIKF